MKKRSVLIRRAALLAAIAVIIAVAVGLSVFFIITGGQASSAARQGVLVPALIAGASALVVALVAAGLLVEKIMHPVMEPVARLRDVAVAMSEGDLDQHADEDAGDGTDTAGGGDATDGAPCDGFQLIAGAHGG